MSDQIMKALDGVEAKLTAMSAKADGEMATIGRVSQETKAAIEAIGVEQRTLAERLLAVEQKGSSQADQAPADQSLGAQFVQGTQYKSIVSAGGQPFGRVSMEVKNTVTNAIANTFSER